MKLLQSIHQMDLYVFNRLMSSPNRSSLSNVARVVSISGDGYVYVMFGLWLWFFQEYQWLWLFLTALGVERAIYFGAKHGFRRRRPQQAIDNFDPHIKPADHFSFPSGHTSAAFLLITLLTWQYGSYYSVMFIWAFAVAWSRMMMGLHFLSDLVVGALVGIGSVWLAHYLSLELS